MLLTRKWLLLAALVNQLALGSDHSFAANVGRKMVKPSVVRTYMDFPKQIDPAHILTIADLNLSIALGSTLVTYNDSNELVAGVAASWDTTSSNSLKFHLRKGLKWSDGSPVIASQYEFAFRRAKKLYGTDLNALFDSISAIEATNPETLVLHFNANVTAQALIMKLAEPTYALVATNTKGALDLSKSVGAYFVQSESSDALSLRANSHWYARTGAEPELVEIRRPIPGAGDLNSFAKDPWVNLALDNSIQRQKTINSFEESHFSVWHRKLDKLFALYPTKLFIARGGDRFIKSLNVNRIVSSLMEGFAGFNPAAQFFPRGYATWSQQAPIPASTDFKSSEVIKVIVPEIYLSFLNSKNLSKLLDHDRGLKLSIEAVPLTEMNSRMNDTDYDVLATGLAIADSNFEGAFSFIIERDPPFIASASGNQDFSARVKTARSLKTTEERAAAMKNIMFDAQMHGYVLPLFHYSSFAVAKAGIDLSHVPESYETVVLSKIRMK
jgi:MarR-like DNA-binding transcriptional regulator SgrR of sgrS sRNA